MTSTPPLRSSPHQPPHRSQTMGATDGSYSPGNGMMGEPMRSNTMRHAPLGPALPTSSSYRKIPSPSPSSDLPYSSDYNRPVGPPSAFPSSAPFMQGPYPPMRRPTSDPNELGFDQMRLMDSPMSAYPSERVGGGGGLPYERGMTSGNGAGIGAGGGGGPMRQNSTNSNAAPPSAYPLPSQGGYDNFGGGGGGGGKAASVHSLDSGMGAYASPGGGGGMGTVYEDQVMPDMPNRRSSGASYGEYGSGSGGMGFAPIDPNASNPYMAAASDYLGMGAGGGGGPSRQPPQGVLRQTSSASELSLKRTPTTAIGSSKAKRSGISAAVDVTKPPYTKEFVDDYRARMKQDPDPEAQFAFAKYLIEAARIIGEDISKHDNRGGKKYRDNLLAESLRVLKRIATEGGGGKGETGYPEAQFFLANMYGTGQLGLQVDHERAYQLYMQASNAGHAAATYRTAVCNELGAGTRKEPNRAVAFYLKAAKDRDPAAMYKVGMIALGGLLGQPKNMEAGVVWLQRAADKADEDNPHALYELAMLYENPRLLGPIDPKILKQDISLAREHYIEAAKVGYAPAQHKLGICYENGLLGCPADPKKSIGWFSRAADRGNPEAELALSGWYLTGAEGVLKQDDREAYLWARRAAMKGLAKAQYALGHYTEVGIGVAPDIEAAKRHYMNSAGQGNQQAKARLQEMTRKPDGRARRPTRQEAKAEGCVIA